MTREVDVVMMVINPDSSFSVKLARDGVRLSCRRSIAWIISGFPLARQNSLRAPRNWARPDQVLRELDHEDGETARLRSQRTV